MDNTTNIFEQASRLKLSFETGKGSLTTYELWDLPLTSSVGKTNLDDLARSLHRRLRSGDDISFVETERKSNEIDQLRFDVVKRVIDVRLEEAKKVSEAKERAEKKQKILALISEKQDESLKTMSVEDLKKLLTDL